jgi:ubiquinone/menaquinone biosynthesis C-methylase UbiE
MRTQFSKTVDDPRVTLSDGAFDHLPGVPDEWADLLIIAQAFHWCPDHATALAEFARVLKPGSSVALVWNLEDRDSARWVAQLRDTIEQHEGGTPQFRLELWRKAFEEPIYKQHFEPPEEKNWPYNIPATVESVVDRASSKSYISILPEDKLSQVHADLREILKRGDGLTWTDMEKGVFEYPYKSYMVICRKRGE